MEDEMELVYGITPPIEYDEYDELMFMEKKASINYCRLCDAARLALSNNMTWGQFAGRFPDAYEIIAKRFFAYGYDFDQWLNDNYDDYSKIDMETLKEKYKSEFTAVEGIPLPEWSFGFSDFYRPNVEHYFLQAPIEGLNDRIPDEIGEKFGTIVDTITGEYFLNFKSKFETEIVKELENYGYTCTKDQKLVEEVFQNISSTRDLINLKN